MAYLNKQELGKWGEQTAADHLTEQGVKILDCNFRTRSGEIDLIGMDDADCLIFFEVKTRQSTHYGLPEQAVTDDKIERIINTAYDYLPQHYIEEPLWRIDVISIIRHTVSGEYQIQWIKNAEN